MAKRATKKYEDMSPSAEEAELLRKELRAWLKRNHLWKGVVWRTADEHYGEAHKQFPFYHYFVLIYESSDLYDVLGNFPSFEPERTRASNLFDEFDAIVTGHGFWFESIDTVTVCILGDEREDADA